MVTVKRSRPASVVLLTILMIFQAINGFVGGGMLVIDPSGGRLGLPVSILAGSPFTDFLVPGLALFVLLGVVPLIVAFALWMRPAWRAAAPLERWTGLHWSWVAAVLVSVALFVFLTVELVVVGYTALLLIFSIVGLAILALALVPSTKGFYVRTER